MASGIEQRTAERLKKATADLGGNQLDRLAFQLGWLCAELDKRDAAIEELKREAVALRNELSDMSLRIYRGLPIGDDK